MTMQFSPRLVAYCQAFSRIASGTAVVVGFLVLVGWTADISLLKRVVPGQLAMKANTAVCFALVGVALWFLRGSPAKDPRTLLRRRIGQAAPAQVRRIG